MIYCEKSAVFKRHFFIFTENLGDIGARKKLRKKETREYIDNSFRNGGIKTTGTDIDNIMPAVSRFGGVNRESRKREIIERLKEFYEKFFGV